LQDDLRTRDDILAALTASENQVADFFTSLSAAELDLRVGTAWTAFEQLDHLARAVQAVAGGFAAPKLLLRWRFGRASRPGRSYIQLRDDYRERLAAGGRASGAFIPAAADSAAALIDRRRDDLVATWRRRNGRLRDALASWSEHQLDTIRLPHPILGKLSAREMLYFAIYHSDHHLAATKRRLPRFAVPDAGPLPL
jgi:hypothetical protein